MIFSIGFGDVHPVKIPSEAALMTI